MLKKYLSEVNRECPFYKMLRWATFLFICSVICFAYLSKVIKIESYIIRFTIALVIIITLVSLIIQYRLVKLFRISSPNLVDALLIIVSITLCFWILFAAIAKNASFPYALAILVLGLLIIVLRAFVCDLDTTGANNNTVDLMNLYNEPVMNNGPLFITENDVSYDLLDRTATIMQLQSAIENYCGDHSVVVGVEGDWGTGKSTLINIVKNNLKWNNNIEIIDDFDPWVFGSQESLLSAMIEVLLRHTNIEYRFYDSKRLQKRISRVVTSVPEVGGMINALLDDETESYEYVRSLRAKMERYLEGTTKKFVFIIDNIERAEADNVILLFKLIGTIFSFPNMIYVLSYSKKRLNSIFSDTKKIDPQYIEKIIQQEIVLPKISKAAFDNVIEKCISNYLISYGINNKEIPEYSNIISIIKNEVSDLRQFKRLLNSAFINTFQIDKNLNKRELLAVEVIRFLRPELYISIYNNKSYYISYDSQVDGSLFASNLNREETNKAGKEYFDELFKVNIKYKNLLAELFPRIKNYNNGLKLISDYPIYEDVEINKNKMIASAKYFDLYFSYGSNYFLKVNNAVESFIEALNIAETSDAVEKIWIEELSELDKSNHKEFMDHLQNYISTIPDKYLLPFGLAIVSNIDLVSDGHQFLSLSAKSRALYIVALIIERYSFDEMQMFTSFIENRYNQIENITEIIKYLGRNTFITSEDVNEKVDMLKEIHKKMCGEILEGINLYDDKYYRKENIWGIYHSDFKDRINVYIKGIFNPETVYRILGDTISLSIGSNGYGYSISKKEFDDFGLNTLDIDQAMIINPPCNESEEFVQKLYFIFKDKQSNEPGVSDIYRKNEFNFAL